MGSGAGRRESGKAVQKQLFTARELVALEETETLLRCLTRLELLMEEARQRDDGATIRTLRRHTRQIAVELRRRKEANGDDDAHP